MDYNTKKDLLVTTGMFNVCVVCMKKKQKIRASVRPSKGYLKRSLARLLV